MNRHVAYLKSVLRHKWFVFVECLKLGVPIWWAILHDWDKFMPWMWGPYADYFYSGKPRRDTTTGTYTNAGESLAFDVAWNGHQKLNKHHWQWWVLFRDDGSIECIPMPDRHRREMLADWRGAGRAYVNGWTPLEPRKWYEKNKSKMRLHPETREWIERTLDRMENEYMDEVRGPFAPRWDARTRNKSAD